MQTNNIRWFASEDQETSFASSRSQSPFRGKRSFTVTSVSLDTSLTEDRHTDSADSADDEMDSVSQETFTINDVMAALSNIGKTLSNLELSMEEVKGEIHSLKVENEKSKQQMEELRGENEYLHTKIGELEHRLSLAESQTNENAQYSRRNNLRLCGVPETKNENIHKVVSDIIEKNLKYKNLRPGDIEAVHRLKQQDSSKPRSIIIRLRRNVRDDLWPLRHNLKGTGFGLIEDLTKSNFQLYHKLRNQDCIEKVWTRDCRIMVQVKQSGKICQVKSMIHLNENIKDWASWVKPKPIENPPADSTNETNETEMDIQHQPQTDSQQGQQE